MKFQKLLFIGIVVFILILFSACKKDEETTNRRPTCEIVSPQDGQKIAWGKTVTIEVIADDSDGSIKVIIFSINGVLKDSCYSFPYFYEWTTAHVGIGIHTIRTTCIDNEGSIKRDKITLEITPDGDTPIADFSASPNSGSSPLTVHFTDQSTNSPTSWQWDFGDGHTSTEQNPSHTYSNMYSPNRSYSISLTATNPNGSYIETKSNYINVGGEAGLPCPDIPTISWQGQTYITVLIGSQCWMKENLNYEIGNSWCYDDDPENCDKYGRLYDWATIMNGSSSSNSNPSGVQGICPDEWHIPSDVEWRKLESTADSIYSYGNSEWSSFDWRGSDAGKRLKSSSGWYDNGHGTDSFGFAAVPGAYRNYSGYFYYYIEGAYFWTSTQNGADNGIYRRLYYSRDQIERNFKHKDYGMSVRCVMD